MGAYAQELQLQGLRQGLRTEDVGFLGLRLINTRKFEPPTLDFGKLPENVPGGQELETGKSLSIRAEHGGVRQEGVPVRPVVLSFFSEGPYVRLYVANMTLLVAA